MTDTERIARLEMTLGTLISRLAYSSLQPGDVKSLLEMLDVEQVLPGVSSGPCRS